MSLREYIKKGLTSPEEVNNNIWGVRGKLQLIKAAGSGLPKFADTKENREIEKQVSDYFEQYKSNGLFRLNHSVYNLYEESKALIAWMIFGEYQPRKTTAFQTLKV